ncbi:MAG: acyl-CoA dehydrogenase family protein [Thermoplasmata archaeon]|nr:MAG: acyl-CoA dehydrogenase family protein [Thermoplasmata archaeon]
MQLQFTEEQEQFRSKIREFCEREIEPRAVEIDCSDIYPWDILKKMAGEGYLGIPIPAEYCGLAKNSVSYVNAIEEISRVSASVGVIVAVHTSVSSLPILMFGTEEQKQRFLVPLAKGEMIGGFALTEPSAGSDAASQTTTAVREGDEYILNGAKSFITSGSEGGVIIVMAMTDTKKRHHGISSFIVEKGMPGFKYGVKEHKMGLMGSDTCELIFEDCRVPVENRLSDEGEGFKIAMASLDGGRSGIGAQALGIAQRALEESVRFAGAKDRSGAAPADSQAVQFMLADMATNITAARLLIYSAADMKDRKEPFTVNSAMAKLYAAQMARDVTIKAVQIHGHQGCTDRHIVERLFREAKVTEIYEGTNEVQRLVIAKRLLS